MTPLNNAISWITRTKSDLENEFIQPEALPFSKHNEISQDLGSCYMNLLQIIKTHIISVVCAVASNCKSLSLKKSFPPKKCFSYICRCKNFFCYLWRRKRSINVPLNRVSSRCFLFHELSFWSACQQYMKTKVLKE